MTRRAKRAICAAIVAGTALAAVAGGPQAGADPGHASCKGFGQEHAFFARELGGLGPFFREVTPLADETAVEHEIFCEPK